LFDSELFSPQFKARASYDMLFPTQFCGNHHRKTKDLDVNVGHVIYEKPFQTLIVRFYCRAGLSEASNLAEILHQAEQSEKEYDWLGAAESYKKVLDLLPEDDFLRKAETYEHLAYASDRAAFQADDNDEFKKRLNQALLIYQRAKEFYGILNVPLKAPRTQQCDAMTKLMSYWLAEKPSEKRKLLEECWELTKTALKAFEDLNSADYGKTFNELSASVDLGYYMHESFQTREKMIRDAIECGERAIKSLSTSENRLQLSKAYAKTALYTEMFYYFFASLEDKEKYYRKATEYWSKAKEISEETAMLELPSVLFGIGPDGYWGSGTEDALANFEKALDYSRKTRDKFLMGRAQDLIAYHKVWSISRTEDPDEKAVIQKSALQHAEDAKHQYTTISFTSPRGGTPNWAEAPYLWYYWLLARRETDLNKKRELLGKALEVAPDTIERAENSGYPDIEARMHATYASVLRESATVQASSEEKKKLLEKALVHNEKSVAIYDQIMPLGYWNLGFTRGNTILTRHELVDLTKDPEDKKIMLQRILLDSQEGLELCIKGTFHADEASRTLMLGSIALWEVHNGDLLRELHKLTGNKEYLNKAVEAFLRGIETYQKTKQTSRLAESYWKIAQTYDALDDHVKAGDNFIAASKSYGSAAESIRQLKDFYHDHALYMQAWNEIENARHDHERQEYGSAKEHFERAAELHKSSKKWNYLESNYSAWVRVENAEELSRKERSEEAIEVFERASRLFSETKKSLQTRINYIEGVDERQMVTAMIRASDLRRQYCDGRIALEEAKILDKKGDHYSSSEKYGSAADTFEKVSSEFESEQDKKELQLIISLSRAWQKMTLAEARSSLALYMEASRIFEQAEDLSTNEKTKLLILGHSHFCKALEAGTRFVDSGDGPLNRIVEQQLESAANYYVRAGFQNASEYSKATDHLFDAYMYMDEAKRERDPEKKARLYAMVEKVLQTSAGSFMKAEHPEKSGQVTRLLDKIREEKELAVSLSEVLHAPSIVSATTTFSAPTPNQENAVGLERFERADVQANLIVRETKVNVGDDLMVGIELVNAGRGSAVLIKLSEIVPEGFELVDKPEIYRVEDSFLNMKGKRLDALKPEEIRITLKPKNQGVFQLKPRISYLDENSKYRYYDTEPVRIVVKELGIKGWLKGES
jgi:exonuclease VII small subunit